LTRGFRYPPLSFPYGDFDFNYNISNLILSSIF